MSEKEQIRADIQQLEDALENLQRGGMGAKREVEGAARVVIDDLRDIAGLTQH